MYLTISFFLRRPFVLSQSVSLLLSIACVANYNKADEAEKLHLLSKKSWKNGQANRFDSVGHDE